MTPALRKIHRRFWFAAAAILPVLFVGAIASIPKPIADPRFRTMQPDPLPVVAREQLMAQFVVRLRSDVSGTDKQVEIIIKKPLSVPEALVYLTEAGHTDITSGIMLGKLSSVGAYRFSLPESKVAPSVNITVYNPFEETVLHTTQFK